jgi:hypothetical protein
MAGLFVLEEQSRPVGVVYAAIEYLACVRALSVPAPFPPGVKERFRVRARATKVLLGQEAATKEAATKAAPARATGRFEEAAMMDARRFAAASCRATAGQAGASLGAANCRAAGHLGASLAAASCRVTAGRPCASPDAGLDHDPLRAARYASTPANRFVAECHRFVAANCRAAGRVGAFLDLEPDREALRAARRASTRADRHGAGRHRIAFHCAKAPHRASDSCFLFRVRLRVQTYYGLYLSALLTLLTPPTPVDAAAARPRAQAVCNRACAKADLSVRLECARALTGSYRRLVRPAQATSCRRAACFHGSGASRTAWRQPGFGETQLGLRSCARICRE